jgi:transposase
VRLSRRKSRSSRRQALARPYASGIRAALPNAVIAVDRWHLVALANQMLTQVRQRATRDQLGRRGTTADPVWVNRRLLLTGAEHLSTEQWRRLATMLDTSDPSREIGAAWAVKERLRMLLKEREPSKIWWQSKVGSRKTMPVREAVCSSALSQAYLSSTSRREEAGSA